MRILWVKAGKILPVDTGGKIRSWNLIRQLAAQHQLTMLSYYDGPRDPEYERALTEALPGSEAIATGYRENGWRVRLRYLRHALHAAPFAVTKFTCSRVRERVAYWLDPARTDVAVCDFLSASLNFPPDSRVPTVLFQHNVESALWARQAKHERNPARRAAFTFEAMKMARFEAATVRRFAHVIAVSDNDRTLMSAMTDASRISVAPTGVDLAQYREGADAKGRGHLVVFLGSMDWEANIDGVEWFCDTMWPRVLASVPDARFRIVGRNPHARVKKLASSSIEVTGSVPSVVEHLREAAVFVVPLRVGGGTRLKIYEAMAAAKASVSTTVGAEGLDVTNGDDIMLEDDPREFAEAIITLLQNEQERVRMGTAAAATAARYDWPVIARQFAETLAGAA